MRIHGQRYSLETFLYVGLPAGWNAASESSGGSGHGPRVIQPLGRSGVIIRRQAYY